MSNPVYPPDDDLEPGESRSFDPPRKAVAAKDGDAPEALKRATDGDQQTSQPAD